MIYVGVAFNGPEGPPDRLREVIQEIRGSLSRLDTGRGSLDLVFVIGGSLGDPEFHGVREGRMARDKAICQIQVGIDRASTAQPDLRHRMMELVADALHAAVDRFTRAGIEFRIDELVQQLDLNAAQPRPRDTSHGPAPAAGLASLTVVFGPRLTPYSVREVAQMEEVLEKSLSEAKQGWVDGHELGEDTVTFLLRGPNADVLVDNVLPRLLIIGPPSGSYLVKRQAGIDASEERLELAPHPRMH